MRRTDLTQGSIVHNIVGFSLPYMLSYLLQIVYGLADLYVIGLYCGVDSTTAVSNGAQVMYMVTVVIIGLAMGTTVMTARSIGAGNKAQTARVIGNSMTVFGLSSLVLAMVLMNICRYIVVWIDTPTEAIAGTVNYLTVCFAGIPSIVAYNVIASVFRGLGDSRSPMYFVAVACVTNVVLDFVLIGHWGMGATGAALATTISQMASVVMAAMALRRHRKALGLKKEDFKPKADMLKRIFKIGVPVAAQDGFIQVAFIAITVIANGRGLHDAAAVGIVEKVIGLLFIVPSAMLSTVSAMSAQNIGAGKMDRALLTLRYAIYVCVGFGTVWAVVLQFYAAVPVAWFTSDATVVALGAGYLQSYAWDCIAAGVHFCFSGFFTAMGYSMISFGHNVVSIVIARIPLSLLASNLYPHTLYPMGLACPIGSLLSVAICVTVYRWMAKSGRLSNISPAVA